MPTLIARVIHEATAAAAAIAKGQPVIGTCNRFQLRKEAVIADKRPSVMRRSWAIDNRHRQ